MIRPYQRFWDDVQMRVEQWAEMGLSLRQIQTELNESLQTNVGLRVLNEQLQAIKQPIATPLTSVPPVVMLDAIWVTVLRPTGEYKKDTRERRRPVKQKHKVPLLVAIGVWPQSGNWEVLDWELADKEDYEGWEALLVRLETRGMYHERGVELFIHDGGKGLTSALKKIFPFVPRQRCVFHKLRNIWQAIVVPDELNLQQARHLRRKIIRQAAAIYQADTLQQALDLRHAFRERWRTTQPAMVATLDRDWHDTITFYKIIQRYPHWRVSCLRTTSLLERLNRNLRRLFRAANAYHSDLGLLAATARVLSPLRAF
jgi:transposase-like protein